MTDHIYKYPRLYLNAPYAENEKILLVGDHAHYLKNVIRKSVGDFIRVFNGADGEWLARIEALSKKGGEAVLTECVRVQPASSLGSLHLFFSPIKKQRMDFLIEKAVELGVTDLHPVLMNRTENRKINQPRVEAQIIEAAEQCERMDVPCLHPLVKLSAGLLDIDVPLYVAMERCDEAQLISSYDYKGGTGFLIGPEGGFDNSERMALQDVGKYKFIDLGGSILRAETAAISCLSYARFNN